MEKIQLTISKEFLEKIIKAVEESALEDKERIAAVLRAYLNKSDHRILENWK